MATNNSKQAAWVALGTVCSHSVLLISAMILSRYFNKSDYGTYKQVLYVYNTLLAVFTLGLPRAYSYFLPQVGNDEAKDVINKINRLFFILGGVFSVFLFIAAPWIADILNNEELTVALRLFSPVPFLLLPTMGLEGVLATYRRTQLMALYTSASRVLMLLCVAIPVMLFGGDYRQAIIGFTLSSLASFCLALYLKYAPVRQFEKKSSSLTYREILNFALPLLYASVWGILLHSASQFFISRYFGNEEFAEFSNGSQEVPFVPMIIGACSAVLSPIYSRLKKHSTDFRADVLPLWRSVMSKTIRLTYPLLLYCAFFAEPLMVALYGDKYIGSAVYFRMMLVLSFFHVIAYGPFVINIGRVRYYANAHCVAAISVILLDILCIFFFKSPTNIMGISVACRIVLVLAMLALIKDVLHVNLIELFPVADILKIFGFSVPVLYLLRLCLNTYFYFCPLVTLIVSLSAYGIVFLLASIPLRLNYTSIIMSILKK